MAIVQDFYIGNTHVMVDDDMYAHLTPEQIQKRKEDAERDIISICMEHRRKEAEAGA